MKILAVDGRTIQIRVAMQGVSPVTTYTLTGPSAGTEGQPSSNFTVTAGSGTIAGTIVITANDSSAGGSFSGTVSLTNSNRSGTFTYTAATTGAITIRTTNNGGLTNPGSIAYTSSGSAVTTYTLTGPSAGTEEQPSSNFTVTAGSGTIAGTIVITANDSSAGGSFSGTVSLTNSNRSGTFTYTAATTGAITIRTTNNGGLTNPGSIAYTSSGSAVTTYTLTGPSAGTEEQPSSNFTVTAGSGTIAGTIVITANDSSAGGSFSGTVSLTNSNRSGTFTYTAATTGAITIRTTNNGGLTNPGSIAYTSSGSAVTTYTLTGPSAGTEEQPSSNFTVTAGSGTIAGTIVITANDSSAGGSFSGTVSLTNSNRSGTFTYTAATTGAITIGTTNNGSLTNPSSLSYTSGSAGSLPVAQAFDSASPGPLSTQISSWSSNAPVTQAQIVATGSGPTPTSGLNCVSLTPSTTVNAWAWYNAAQFGDAVTSISYWMPSSDTGAGAIARGSGLSGSSPTYYALTYNVTGGTLNLLKVVAGVSTTLATTTLLSTTTLNLPAWTRLTLSCTTVGGNIQLLGQFYYQSSGYVPAQGSYLTAGGDFLPVQSWAVSYTDSSAPITSAGYYGILKLAGTATARYFDDWAACDGTTSATAAITNSGLSFTTTTSHAAGIARVEYWVDSEQHFIAYSPPFTYPGGPTGLSGVGVSLTNGVTWTNGSHTVEARAFSFASEATPGTSSTTATVSNSPAVPLVTLPRSVASTWIRQATAGPETMFPSSTTGPTLGTGSFEDYLLANFTDLAAQGATYATYISGLNPNVQLAIYNNFTNLYANAYTGTTPTPGTPTPGTSNLLDWLAYADANSYAREGAFWHAASAQAWASSGNGGTPIQYFWVAFLDTNGGTVTDYTAASQTGTTADTTLGTGTGDCFYAGFPDPFREIDITLGTAGSGWTFVVEYPSAVSAPSTPASADVPVSTPVTWTAVSNQADGTSGGTTGGSITWDATLTGGSAWLTCFPTNIAGVSSLLTSKWVTCLQLDGATPFPMHFVRVRTTGGTPPIAAKVLGRDFTLAASPTATSGTILYFNSSLDVDADNYLDSSEYFTSGTGTIGITNGSTAVTFSASQSGLAKAFIQVTGDATNGLYQIASGSGTSWTLTAAYTGTTQAAAAWNYGSGAMFLYESRLPSLYGPGRTLTNCGNADFQAWAIDYTTRRMSVNTGATVVFSDNAAGDPPIGTPLESTASTYSDCGALHAGIWRSLPSDQFVYCNTDGESKANGLVALSPAAQEESFIAPMADSWSVLQQREALIASRWGMSAPSPLVIVDVSPLPYSQVHPRTNLGAMAYYYLLANSRSMLGLWQGYAPGEPLVLHWCPAAATDLGTPLGRYQLWQTGNDPTPTVQAAINAALATEYTTGQLTAAVTGNGSGPWTVAFSGSDTADLLGPMTFSNAGLQPAYNDPYFALLCAGSSTLNTYYVLDWSANHTTLQPTSGTFTLGVTTSGGGTQTTGAITYSTNTATLAGRIQAALAALSNVEGDTTNSKTSNVVVVPGENAGTFVIAFQQGLGLTNGPTGMAVVSTSSLSGTLPGLSVAGSSPYTTQVVSTVSPKPLWGTFTLTVPTTAGPLTTESISSAAAASSPFQYRVYLRWFTDALVLFRPLSYAKSYTGPIDDNTSVTFTLPPSGNTYYPLAADGSVGSSVTTIALRGGEGAIFLFAP